MDYSVGPRSLVLLLAMVQGIIIALLLLVRGLRRRQVRDFFLAGLLFALATSLISYTIGFMGAYDYAREQGWDLTFFPFGNSFLYGPLIWLYVQTVTDRQFRWHTGLWKHFILPGAYYLLSFYLWSLPMEEKNHAEHLPLDTLQDLLLALTLGYYLLRSLRRFATYRRLLDHEYSNTSRLVLDWLRNFLYVFTAYFVVNLAFNLTNLWVALWYTGWFWLELTRAVLLYYISVTGWAFTQKTVVPFDLLEQREVQLSSAQTGLLAEKTSAGKTVFSPEELAQRREKLSAFMQENRPWLDPDLTLSQLAQLTGMNVSQLSYLVNAGFGKNFNDFINAFRVEEVKRKMNAPDTAHLSLLGVAFECGFNSKATFNRAFKKATGVAPSAFSP